ncbi:MAG: arsenite methyltransferase [Phycisphaerales bacterium]|nr:arsenite methyltransferase [Phycisphaerales bacterium]
MNVISRTVDPSNPDAVRAEVRSAYAQAAAGTSGCCGPTCCGAPPSAVADMSSRMGYSADEIGAAPEGANLGLGCGNPQTIAALKSGEAVLDLGAGAGFDCFLAARRVGPTGRVIGVDMTPEMLAKARENARKGGYENVEFRLGEIERLPVADASVDVVMSNCVINLSPDKPAALREAFRALRPGGRLAVSDIVATAPMPEALKAQAAALTGCVSGAATVQELTGWLADAGFQDVRVTLREESRAMVDEWLPGSGAGRFVASATIEARKPG